MQLPLATRPAVANVAVAAQDICPVCGAPWGAGSSTCRYCGAVRQQPTPPVATSPYQGSMTPAWYPPPQPNYSAYSRGQFQRRRRGNPIAVVVFLIFWVFAAGIGVINNGNNSTDNSGGYSYVQP